MRNRQTTSGKGSGGMTAMGLWLAMAVIGSMASGCGNPAKPPPFEWWVDPLPAPPAPVKKVGRIVRIGVLVRHTGPRDDFGTFKRTVRNQHRRVSRGELPGFRAACRYLPKLAGEVQNDLERGLAASGWFVPIERRRLDKALRTAGVTWLDLRRPAAAAEVGRMCGAELMLLVEITGCEMQVVEARRQTIGTETVGPVRKTQVTIRYGLCAVDVSKGTPWWQSKLSRRAGYKLEGPGSMGHWYWPRDPLEFRQALRGQGITEFVLRGLVGTPGAKATPAPPAIPAGPGRIP